MAWQRICLSAALSNNLTQKDGLCKHEMEKNSIYCQVFYRATENPSGRNGLGTGIKA